MSPCRHPANGWFGGLRGWQRIFIQERLFTVCFDFFSFFILPSGPDFVLTLRHKHPQHCITRLQLDTNNTFASEPVALKKVLSILLDLHLWITCVVLFYGDVCLFGLVYISLSIVQSVGYRK
ncbi:hypothetical protein EYZ11_000752 [Aspergillus tanneri]|uniref:Uncharacterized protein n=1 Tax=Aspergillus tanneri TaxID=1220188 RepID=A0A4S3JWG5_9EURO|nr:hypothetical protein EYZ11_000752 [Aspergillus tanneri]